MMKIDISFIHPGQEEGDDPAGSYQVETDHTDWSNITPDEVRARQKARDSFELPNGEVLDIKAYCFDSNFTINIRQDGKLLTQLEASCDSSLIFPTLAGGTVFFEIHFGEQQEPAGLHA